MVLTIPVVRSRDNRRRFIGSFLIFIPYKIDWSHASSPDLANDGIIWNIRNSFREKIGKKIGKE